MKKLTIAIGVLMIMSFTNNLWNYDLSEAITDLEDYKEWMQTDIESGRIDEEIGVLYFNNFEETIRHLKNVDRINVNYNKDK